MCLRVFGVIVVEATGCTQRSIVRSPRSLSHSQLHTTRHQERLPPAALGCNLGPRCKNPCSHTCLHTHKTHTHTAPLLWLWCHDPLLRHHRRGAAAARRLLYDNSAAKPAPRLLQAPLPAAAGERLGDAACGVYHAARPRRLQRPYFQVCGRACRMVRLRLLPPLPLQITQHCLNKLVFLFIPPCTQTQEAVTVPFG